MNSTWLLLLASAGLLGLAVHHVPRGQAHTLHRFGAYRRTLDSGLHWIVPFCDRISHRIRLSGHALHFPAVQCSVADAALRLSAQLWYQVIDPEKVHPRATELDDFVLESTHAALDDLAPWISTLEGLEFDTAIKTAVNQRLRPHGLLMVRCTFERSARF